MLQFTLRRGIRRSWRVPSLRGKATLAEEEATVVPAPTRAQLKAVFVRAALPMIGFGFMDQTVMLQAGNAIDCSLGVTFGLSTLTAAAFGQVCSDAAGVLSGGTVESIAHAVGMPPNKLSVAQRSLRIVQRTKFAGTLLGVVAGCLLGLVNLLFIDTERSSTLKLQEEFANSDLSFGIEASNKLRNDVTALTVRGPDVDGVLASMSTALAVQGSRVVELHAKGNAEHEIEDVFYVVSRETGRPYEDDELDELAQAVLEATRKPMSVVLLKNQLKESEDKNTKLLDRVRTLESKLGEQPR